MQLDRDGQGRFIAKCEGETVVANAVVVATGFRDYANVPHDQSTMLPAGRYGHTCDVVDFEGFRGRSVIIVGGRQSAFESAALLAEAGARSVDVVYRHDTPDFAASDWSWVMPLMLRTESDPSWYRELPAAERAELNARFWGEGRLKLEPWLAPRLERPEVRLWPRDKIAGVENDGDCIVVRLESGGTVEADFALFATGYKVDVARLPFLAGSGLLGQILTRNGSPSLDTTLQSSIEGLYFTSIAATQDGSVTGSV
jgi:cation diffusion facilitator CzcD-associated flavoprotein CzcO